MIHQPSRVTYASGWRRFGAYVIDTIILYISFILVGVAISAVTAVVAPDTAEGAITAFAYAFAFLAGWVYFAGLESSSRQATAGKQALGIVVTDERGERLTFARATGRYFAKGLSSLTFGIGYLMIAFTGRKQGLHDKVANTVVVAR